MAHINQGVIAGLFTSGVVFTSVLFWIIYREKIGAITLFGMAVIMSGVICVGIQPPKVIDSEIIIE